MEEKTKETNAVDVTDVTTATFTVHDLHEIGNAIVLLRCAQEEAKLRCSNATLRFLLENGINDIENTLKSRGIDAVKTYEIVESKIADF